MSVVTIQIGRCGNQVGYDWYTSLAKESGLDNITESLHDRITCLSEYLERWFHLCCDGKLFARTVLIDSEQKVVQEVCEKSTTTQVWKYNPLSVVYTKNGGSGNNWAMGYHLRGREMHEEISDCIRREVENCDRLLALNNILSCAGGTGSGLGSHVIGRLRDEYPTKCIINSLIFPCQGGEVITQNYNTVLTLSKIYDISNIHVVFQNDNLHKFYHNLSGSTCIRLHDLNSLISMKLSSFLQPINNGQSIHLPNIISDLTPHPCYKMVSVKTAPHFISRYSMEDMRISWTVLLKHMLRSLRESAAHEEIVFDWKSDKPMPMHTGENSLTKYVDCLVNMLITRGIENVNNTDTKDFHWHKLYSEWIPFNSGFHHLHQKEVLFGLCKFVALISNNSSMHKCLNNVVEKAWIQFSQKAYLHQFTKYGLSEEEMVESFVKFEDVARYYSDLK